MLDNAPVTIGMHVLIGTMHNCIARPPTDYRRRSELETTCLEIVVEYDVCIGGKVVICQSDTIGVHSVVAGGSVVT